MGRASPLRDERAVRRRGGKPVGTDLRELASGAPDEAPPPRPRTRGECADGPRPCPWVGCQYHLYLDVNPQTGGATINFPGLDPTELRHTCALDRADQGEHTLEDVGALINVSRERIRQVQQGALRKIAQDPRAGRALRQLHEASLDREREGSDWTGAAPPEENEE